MTFYDAQWLWWQSCNPGRLTPLGGAALQAGAPFTFANFENPVPNKSEAAAIAKFLRSWADDLEKGAQP